MLTFYDGSQKEPFSKLLLKQIAEWIRVHRDHMKWVQRNYQQSERLRRRRELRVLEAELRLMRGLASQINFLQNQKKRRRSSMIEQPPRKRQVEGLNPSDGSNFQEEI